MKSIVTVEKLAEKLHLKPLHGLEYLDVDASILRVIFVFLTWSGMPILLYILLAIIMPSEKRPVNKNYYDPNYRPRKEARKVEEDDSDWSDF